jgi:hypothetical protein
MSFFDIGTWTFVLGRHVICAALPREACALRLGHEQGPTSKGWALT